MNTTKRIFYLDCLGVEHFFLLVLNRLKIKKQTVDKQRENGYLDCLGEWHNTTNFSPTQINHQEEQQ
jgi:hypothetical protein